MSYQQSLPCIDHHFDKNLISQRISDGYINATAMCKSVNKLFADYYRLESTKNFLQELSNDMGIPISALIQAIRGGNGEQGTWVHPDVATNLGQWLSPKFAVAVSKWIREWLMGANRERMPYHIRRYITNRSKIPHTHFSIFNELIFRLIAPLEEQGYILPDKMIPDISEGKMFCNWLKNEKGIDPKSLLTYKHVYPDGRIVEAKMYPNYLLADFIAHFNETWMPKQSVKYFKKRDEQAIEYLAPILERLEIDAQNEESRQLSKIVEVEYDEVNNDDEELQQREGLDFDDYNDN